MCHGRIFGDSSPLRALAFLIQVSKSRPSGPSEYLLFFRSIEKDVAGGIVIAESELACELTITRGNRGRSPAGSVFCSCASVKGVEQTTASRTPIRTALSIKG